MAHRIGILSDTHGVLYPSAAKLLHTCEVILHCGDFGTPQVLENLRAIAPVYAVRGNIDTGREFDDIPKTRSLNLFGVRVFLIHNQKLIQENLCDRDLVICGHTHKYEYVNKNGQFWLNPGSCGRKRFFLPVTMAVMAVQGDGSFQIEKIELEKIELEKTALETAMQSQPAFPKDIRQVVIRVMKETEKGRAVDAIAQSCGISTELAEQICRLYLTHPGVSADGILGKMGL